MKTTLIQFKDIALYKYAFKNFGFESQNKSKMETFQYPYILFTA